MPSHIFVQLGMWDDVSSQRGGLRRVEVANRAKEPAARTQDFHAVVARYDYLQLGKVDEAKKCVEIARQTAVEDKSDRVRNVTSGSSRYVIETERWAR
jgi:hypothetical protein